MKDGSIFPEKRFFKIGEVSQLTGLKPYVLRYWETEFRWMAPPKSRSKQRLYRRRDIETILTIKRLLYDEGFTIAGAKKRLGDARHLRGGGHASGRINEAAARATLETVRTELRRLLTELSRR
ncbi:MAG: MerR family transcriptional regulator [Acidobacteria bacterium]|nr:MerR family transcriptional regulator [Acidobacteriota bacterium]